MNAKLKLTKLNEREMSAITGGTEDNTPGCGASIESAGGDCANSPGTPGENRDLDRKFDKNKASKAPKLSTPS